MHLYTVNSHNVQDKIKIKGGEISESLTLQGFLDTNYNTRKALFR